MNLFHSFLYQVGPVCFDLLASSIYNLNYCWVLVSSSAMPIPAIPGPIFNFFFFLLANL